MGAGDEARWFRSRACARVRRRLFCFHHAGGGAALFRDWQAACPADVAICAATLPGRDGRYGEPLIERMDLLAQRLAAALPTELPFAFFGHSMGALLAFEVARQLQASGRALPQRLYVSACSAPQHCWRDPPRSQLGDARLIALLGGFGGTPQALLADPGYLSIVLPILRADFQLIDGYRVPAGGTLRVPITAYAGRQDRALPPDRLAEWQRWTDAEFVVRSFGGDHFYLHEQRQALLEDLFGRWPTEPAVHAGRFA